MPQRLERLERLRSSGREAQGEKPEVPWKTMYKHAQSLVKKKPLRPQKPRKDKKKDRLGRKECFGKDREIEALL